MKELFYNFMIHICWLLESVHDFFTPDVSLFYPSMKWEILYEKERAKKARGKTWKN